MGSSPTALTQDLILPRHFHELYIDIPEPKWSSHPRLLQQRNPKYIHIVTYQCKVGWKWKIIFSLQFIIIINDEDVPMLKWEDARDRVPNAHSLESFISTVHGSMKPWNDEDGSVTCNHDCTYVQFILSTFCGKYRWWYQVLLLRIKSSSFYKVFLFLTVCGPGEWLILRITYQQKCSTPP